MIDRDTAREDFERFVKELKVNDIKRSHLEEEEENAITYIEQGYLTVSENGELTYQLMYPIEVEEGEDIEKLTFRKKRVRVEDMEKKMVGKNDMEKTRKIFAFLTNGVNSGIFSKVDADDFKAISDIAAFFLPR